MVNRPAKFAAQEPEFMVRRQPQFTIKEQQEYTTNHQPIVYPTQQMIYASSVVGETAQV